MKKLILIVNIDENFNKANVLIKEFAKDNPLVLYLNNRIINNSINYIIAEDLISKNYFFEMDKNVRKLMNCWYKPLEKELSYFDISLGQLINFDFIKIWHILFKIDIILSLIKREAPREIYLITEDNKDIKILKEIVRYKGLKFNYTKIDNKPHKNLNLLNKSIAKLQNLYFKISLFRISKKNKILFIGNLRQSLPIFKELKKNKSNLIIRAGENVGRGFFSKYFDYYITFSEFSTLKLNRKLGKIRREFIAKWRSIKDNKNFKNKIYYKVPLFDILEEDLENIFLNRFVSLIKYIEIMKILRNRFDIVVTQNDLVPFEKTIIKTANKLVIPTLTTIDGTLSDNLIKKRENDYIPPSTQKIALFSDNQKRTILKEFKGEIPEDRLVVTGFPIFDDYYNNKPKINKEKICKMLGIDKNKKIILYITEQYSQKIRECSLLGLLTKKQHKKRYIELFELIEKIPNLHLIIKSHPSGSLEDSFINDITNEMGVRDFVIVENIDIYSLINASDVLITRLSTVGLEAMILKKPVIIFDTYSDTSDYFDYTEFGAALHAKEPGELLKVLNRLFDNKYLQKRLQYGMEKFINKNYNKNDGKASRRVADLIEDMMKPKNFKTQIL